MYIFVLINTTRKDKKRFTNVYGILFLGSVLLCVTCARVGFHNSLVIIERNSVIRTTSLEYKSLKSNLLIAAFFTFV